MTALATSANHLADLTFQFSPIHAAFPIPRRSSFQSLRTGPAVPDQFAKLLKKGVTIAAAHANNVKLADNPAFLP
jgi:hypothetical protein